MADDLLNAAAEALGAPPEMVQRSAEARAAAEGTTVEEVLRAWAGGAPAAPAADVPTPETEATPAEELTPSEQEAEAPAEEPDEEPQAPSEPEPMPTPEPLPASEPPPVPETVPMDRAEEFEVVTTVATASLKERTRAAVPGWLGSLFVVLPLLAVLLLLSSQSPECGQSGALAVEPVTGQIVNCDGSEFTGAGPGDGGVANFLAIGREIYRGQGACFSCHGAEGEGVGAFPSLTPVLDTFSACADHRTWVTLGSTGWLAEVGSTFGDTDKPVNGGMPTFGGTLTEEQIQSVTLFERVSLGGAALEESLGDCGLAEPPATEGPPEEGADTPGTEG
ncbi:MAG: c-type cytochrome [Acidimicrobiia bacterium]